MQTSGLVTGLSGRYATALFELARDKAALADVGASLDGLRQALAENADLRALVGSPLIRRTQARSAMAALAGPLGLDPLTANFLQVLAANRRLPQLPTIIRDFRRLAAAHRGEVTANVTTAYPLSEAQRQALADKLRTHLRRDVAMEVALDPAILGGLIVQIGSRRIDASIQTKLAAIGAAMKG